MSSRLAWGYLAALAALVGTSPALAQEPAKNKPEPAPNKVDLEAMMGLPGHFGDMGGGGNPAAKFRDFNELTRGAERIDGFFTLFKKDDHLYCEIKPHQFEQPMLAPIVISKGMGSAGTPLNFGDEWVVLFHRAGDRVQLIRRNVHYKAPAGTPIEKAVKQNYTDSILMALPIQSLNPAGGMSVVIDLDDIFFNDFAQLGSYDRSKTTWHKIKAFPNNLELQVETTMGGGHAPSYYGGGDDGVIDYRGATVVIHYSLVKLPDAGYRPRYADDRVGHFLNATKDFGHADPDTNFVRMINRWRIEKADHSAKMSPPKHRMIWWVENTVPDEYRPYVQAGIEEWNKAFEPLGIRNAIEVRWQTEKDEFDPEDINYCTFKWITTNQTYAMSCLRSNPLTGEMIDGDVIFDAGFIKAYKKEYALLTGTSANGMDAGEPIAVGEILSPILAAKKGFGLPNPLGMGSKNFEVRPADWTELQSKLRRRMSANGNAGCQYSCGMQYEMGLAALALADGGKAGPGEGLNEEFIGQGIKEVVMHEVGHSLGLRHNFKASTMLPADKLHDTEVTRKKGLVGSVMDYSPINIAQKGQKQGDYYTTTIGPYDYWAIEYAYKPIDGNEEAELKKIAARAPEADLVFATDDDMYGSGDPQVNVWDMGQDPCKFALERIDLAAGLLKDLDTKAVKDGQSWVKNREAFGILMAQYGNGAALIGGYIGGQSVNRDHKGDKDGRDPVVPVPGAGAEALKLLVDKILSDKAFQFSPALLRRMGTEKWTHWGSSAKFQRADVIILERVLGIQEIALDSCLNAATLAHLENQEMQADAGTDPLKLAEVFRTLSDGVWSELAVPADAKALNMTTIRRNLQREYIKRLATMVLGEKPANYGSYSFILFVGNGGSVPADARALGRLHLREIGAKIAKVLDNKGLTIDDTTRAHLEETQHRIAKVLDASLDDNQP